MNQMLYILKTISVISIYLNYLMFLDDINILGNKDLYNLNFL